MNYQPRLFINPKMDQILNQQLETIDEVTQKALEEIRGQEDEIQDEMRAAKIKKMVEKK